jgi:hypothetical protein
MKITWKTLEDTVRNAETGQLVTEDDDDDDDDDVLHGCETWSIRLKE